MNKYKINNNNKTNTKHEFNVKYERYKKYIFGKKIVISEPLLYRRPLLLRQLKNNQNQTNTTGAHNFKEFINTARWLSVFFGVFVCNELIK